MGGLSGEQSKRDYTTKIFTFYRNFEIYPLAKFLIKRECNEEQEHK